MTDQPDDVIDCQTCLAANTTACADCIVGHLLANDDGPIELVAVPTTADSAIEAAVDLFARAGLLDDPPCLVSREAFDRGQVPERTPNLRVLS